MMMNDAYYGHILVGVEDILHHVFVLSQELSYGHYEHGHKAVSEEFWPKICLHPHCWHL